MTSFRLLRPLDGYGRKRPADAARSIGGKAARLAWLGRHGLPVPRGWVLEAKYFDEIALERVPANHSPHALLKLRSGSALQERAAHARALILSQALPSDLALELEALWALVEPNAPWGLAVRSSATCEDDDMTSMAGLAATELGVRGASQLADAVRKVWASALLPRALLYLATRGVREVSMAVVFQVVVPAEAAGVAFSAPPRGAPGELFQQSELLVNAAFGLGAPVVDGATTPDVVKIDRATGAVDEYLVADKRQALVVGAAGLQTIDLVAKKARSPALEPWALARLAELARSLQELEPKGAIDFEFVVESDRVWIVQARPALGAAFPDGGDAETVWSRANVGEALPGAATPLTWSIARSFSERGFRKAFSSLGCTVPRGARLVANVHSRFYLNLTLFMRIAAQVPGLDPKTLIDLGGGSEVEILEKQVAGVSRRAFYARLPLTAARLLTEQMRLAGEVERFEAHAAFVRQSLGAIDFTILPDDALAAALRDARTLLDRCGVLMLSCASASLASHVALKTVLARASPVGAERIAQALSAGVGDLESALPGIALNRVAVVARHDEQARRALESGQVRALADLPEGETRRAFAQFLVTHGDRAVREAELATPRWREDPSVPLAMLSATLKASRPDPVVQLKSARERAEHELAETERRLSMVEMSLVRVLVTRSQRFARLRERTRAWVTRVLGMLRLIALEIDRRLVRADPELGTGAVFFCTYDELLTVLRAGLRGVNELVQMRRAEFARDEGRPDPPVSFVGCPPAVVLPPASGVTLRGLPASGGVVEGRARVLSPGGHDSARLAPGEVLIARTTDVGLSPLFLVAAAVVTELGGPLSHAALVAREYGVPAVVNVPSVTTAIKTGDLVRVDGDRGIVERLVGPADNAVRSAPILVVCKDETTVAAMLPRFGDGAARALDEGRIFVGKRRAVASDAVRPGDEVWLYPARPLPREPPRILLEREGVVAAYKPPDMATVADHRGSAGSLETVVKEMLGQRAPLVATSRLDVGVSGVVLFATDEASRRALARAREQGRYLRHYVAVSATSPAPARGLWTGSIGRAVDPRLRRVGGPSAATAETAYAVTSTAPKGALLAVEPKTGRTHQIRVHAAHAGCPLWGDAAYGGPTRLVADNGTVAPVERVALHAAWVEVTLAENANWRVEAPPPRDFGDIWAGCGGDLSAFAGAWAAIYPETQ